MIKDLSEFYTLHKEIINFAFGGIGLSLIALFVKIIQCVYKRHVNKKPIDSTSSKNINLNKQETNKRLNLTDFNIIDEIRWTFTGDTMYIFYENAKKCMLNTNREKLFSEKCGRFRGIDKVISIDEVEKSKNEFLEHLNDIIKFFSTSQQRSYLCKWDGNFVCIKQVDISTLSNLINTSTESYKNLINVIKKYDYNFDWNDKSNIRVIPI